MAIRPIFISTSDIENPFIKEDINFKWISGMSYIQKCKRRDSLKEEIEKIYDINKWLEVSTKSDKDIGIKLSALNLELITSSKKISVENVYQNSKVFENGKITGFKYGSTYFENNPYGMYYDYIYMLALYQHLDLIEQMKDYNIFTDIEFNPQKSLNTQGRAVAIFKTLLSNDYLKILENQNDFKKYYKKYVKLK